MSSDSRSNRSRQLWDKEASANFPMLRKIPAGGYRMFFDYVDSLESLIQNELFNEIGRGIELGIKTSDLQSQCVRNFILHTERHGSDWAYLPLKAKRFIGRSIQRKLRAGNPEIVRRASDQGFSEAEFSIAQNRSPSSIRNLQKIVTRTFSGNFALRGGEGTEHLAYALSSDPAWRVDVYFDQSASQFLLCFYHIEVGGKTEYVFPAFEDVICGGQCPWDDISTECENEAHKVLTDLVQVFLESFPAR